MIGGIVSETTELIKLPFALINSYWFIIGVTLEPFQLPKLITAIGPLPENGVVEIIPTVINPRVDVVLANKSAPEMREPAVTLGESRLVAS